MFPPPTTTPVLVGPRPEAPVPADPPGIVALCPDARRSHRAMLHAIILPLLALGVMLLLWQPNDHWVAAIVALALAAYNLYVLAYTILTWRIFARVDANVFRQRMAARMAGRRPAMQRLLPNGDGPSFAISSTIIAFFVVLLIPHIQAFELDDWLLVPISLTILLSCWGLSVLSYALHYAQHDLATPSFEIPGDRTRAFEDYVYFSIGVATTLGVTDVNVTSPTMRRTVNFHVIVAFLFNSVVVALLASILIR